MRFSLTENQCALLALVLIAICASFRPDGKEVYIGIASAIGGWMSKGASHAVSE